MKPVAVIGGGMSGLMAAMELSNAGERVVLYEKNDYLGCGFASAFNSTGQGGLYFDVDFMVFNPATFPNILDAFEKIGVDIEESEFSFSISLEDGNGYEWGTRTGISSIFTQKSNTVNPYFWQMLREISKFKNDSFRYLEDLEQNLDTDPKDTFDNFVKQRAYSDLFKKAYLMPICSSVWSSSAEGVMTFSAYTVLSFFRDHFLLEPFRCSQGMAIRWGACSFVEKIREHLESKGCQIRTSCEVHSVTSTDDGCVVAYGNSSLETYKECIVAINASSTLKLLGKQTTYDEMRVLGAFQYVYSDIFLHRDKGFMPLRPAAWSTCNFQGTLNEKPSVTYWLNMLQSGSKKKQPYLVTLNPSCKPDNTLLKWSTGILLPTISASKASLELDHIQGKRGLWFCRPHHGYGFNAEKLKAGIETAYGALRKGCTQLSTGKHIVPSFPESGARILVTRFFKNYISTGCLILLEGGGTVFTFKGTSRECPLKTTLVVHNPQFYWKIATEADLGLADAYIHGDFSVVDGNEGLLNLFMILISNWMAETTSSKFNNARGRWTQSLYTASISSAKFFFKHLRRQNTIAQARRNISRHYDLSNKMFALFLDETMTYSCAVFKSEDEDLKVAQLRKMSLLIEKGKIKEDHEVLEIGCGWGSLAIEVVKKTGCKYTGITLSEEQLRLAESKVKESGLQDRIRFLLCDYRTLPRTFKCDCIISCEMIEHAGHEYINEFFGVSESLLAEDGILVLQFTAYPDSEYNEYRRRAGFIKEYIFQGGCLPSLSRITSGMASSKLCVEHVENIGIHFYQTLRCWRKTFLQNKSKIMEMGFDEKFIRTWEYYFDYTAAGFKSRMLGNYQIVFSRPGNQSAFSDPYKGFPSAYKTCFID